MIKKIYIKYQEITNYLFFGILTTIINLITYYILILTILNPNNPLELQISNIIAWIISVTFAYITNKKYVFKSNETNIKKEIIKFYTSRLTTLFIDISLMFIFVTILKLNDKLIKLIIAIIIIILNYILSSTLSFSGIVAAISLTISLSSKCTFLPFASS